MKNAIGLGFCLVLLAGLPLDFARAEEGVWPVDGKVIGKNGKKAEDVSGLACVSAAGFPRDCLIVDDESQGAQWVRLNDDRLVTDENSAIRLISDTHGGKPMELDAEGVAFDDGAFYVAGSHGAPRKDEMSEAEWIARVKADSHVFRIIAREAPDDSAGLRPLLLADPVLSPFVDLPLEPNGLTIEGLAVMDDRAFFGMRGPVVNGCAVIFEASIDGLFEGGVEAGRSHLLNLGSGRGVRDLTPLGDDLLVLAGPVGEGGSYSVFRWTPPAASMTAPAEHVADLEPVDDAKAEGILVLDADPLRVLGLFDGPDEGGPREISLTWGPGTAPSPAPGCPAV